MVTILFARSDSVYKKLPECDVWDKQRDATLWPGGNPVIAHPPCRAWGRLRHFSHPEKGEKDLAFYALLMVRQFGGVLEHPFASTLWPEYNLPVPGYRDAFGGWTMPVLQQWFGHRAEKATLLYFVGLEPIDLPPIPFQMGPASHVVQSRKRDSRPHISKAEREHTPVEFAKWLLRVASKTSPITAQPHPQLAGAAHA